MIITVHIVYFRSIKISFLTLILLLFFAEAKMIQNLDTDVIHKIIYFLVKMKRFHIIKQTLTSNKLRIPKTPAIFDEILLINYPTINYISKY